MRRRLQPVTCLGSSLVAFSIAIYVDYLIEQRIDLTATNFEKCTISPFWYKCFSRIRCISRFERKL